VAHHRQEPGFGLLAAKRLVAAVAQVFFDAQPIGDVAQHVNFDHALPLPVDPAGHFQRQIVAIGMHPPHPMGASPGGGLVEFTQLRKAAPQHGGARPAKHHLGGGVKFGDPVRGIGHHNRVFRRGDDGR